MTMRDAITTTYVPATDTEGAMIRATSGEAQIVIPFRGNLSHVANHKNAAVGLCQNRGWRGQIVGGATTSDASYVWVFADDLIPVGE